MKHKVIDIYFNDKNGRDDCTQFDFHDDWNDTIGAWQDFCNDNDLEFGSISGFDIYEIDEPGYEGDSRFVEDDIGNPKCPSCESDNALYLEVTDAHTSDEDWIIDRLHCEDCGLTWQRMYKYVYSIKED